jgi:sirohydrochlorin cobaltochelatase
MDTILVLAMHGSPPHDFPRQELGEFFGLHARLEQVQGPERQGLERRHDELHARMRAWPRTAQNDPFWAASLDLAQALSEVVDLEVVVGFGEFCGPSLDEALDQAAAKSESVVVVTPMMTRGGEHAEQDIPAAIRRAEERHPGCAFLYAWPFETSGIARFLAEQTAPLLEG